MDNESEINNIIVFTCDKFKYKNRILRKLKYLRLSKWSKINDELMPNSEWLEDSNIENIYSFFKIEKYFNKHIQ